MSSKAQVHPGTSPKGHPQRTPAASPTPPTPPNTDSQSCQSQLLFRLPVHEPTDWYRQLTDLGKSVINQSYQSE
ncbi:hypothetical protein E2C01_067872 [Portunus trituberculatus]|uniref:Uncharacterized protein n=1 Tax=Portunus trituberculatus TaxID=210409 RepID=A0A5B7HUV4_PORTR|nr:hypothetical protein [Portunus trituberculatus]